MEKIGGKNALQSGGGKIIPALCAEQVTWKQVANLFLFFLETVSQCPYVVYMA